MGSGIYNFCSDFDKTSSDLPHIVHGCLFSITDPRFLIALERYCWAFFIASKLSSVGTRPAAPWADFALSKNELGDPIDPEEMLNSLQSDPVAGVGWNVASNGKVPGVVATSLVLYNDTINFDLSLDDGDTSESATNRFGGTATHAKYAFTAAQLCDSLSYSSTFVDPTSSLSPFVMLSDFFEELLDMTQSKSEQLESPGLWYRAPTSISPRDPSGVIRNRTSSRGLSARSLFLECFNLFRKVFSVHDSGNDNSPILSRIPDVDIQRNDYDLDMPGTLTNNLIPFSSTHDGVPVVVGDFDDQDLADERVGTSFQFSVPVRFFDRGVNAEEACEAIEPTTEFTLFTDVTKSLEKENKAVVRAMAHLGAIADALQEKRTDVGSVMFPGLELIQELLPRGQAPSKLGKELVSRTGSPHVANIYKTLERRLPFKSKSGSTPNAAAFTSLAKTTSGSPGGSSQGRFAALNLLLNSENLKVSEDNVFDPTNTQVFCIGIPLGSYLSLVTDRVIDLSAVDVEPGGDAGLSITQNELVQDNTLIKISFTKKDSMLPTLSFSDISYYYDPNLFVAADGFFDVNENSDSLESVLSSVRFKRAVVSSTGSVTVEEVSFSDEDGFEGGGYISSLNNEVAKQLAYVTVMSDLLCYYTALVSGIEVSEDAFCTMPEVLEQLIDSEIGDLVQIPVEDLLESFASSTNVPIPPLTAKNSVINIDELESSKRIKTLNEVVEDGTLGEDLPSQFVQAQRSFSSLLFRPKSERVISLCPKRFAGIAFLPIDPDTFRIEDPEGSGFGNSEVPGENPAVVRTALQNAGLEIVVGDNVFIVKSGNSEDATSVSEIIVEANFVSLSEGGLSAAESITNGIPNDPFDAVGQ